MTSATASRLPVSRARSRARATIGAAAALLAIAVVIAVAVGSEPVSVLRALADPASLDHTLLFEVRLPRVLLGAIAGGGLAIVGGAFQGLLKNPLAEPFILGVSGGAALGASIAIASGLASALAVVTPSLGGVLAVPAAAFAGGLAATALVFAVARGAPRSSGTTMLLAGVMVNAIAAALITFVKTLVAPWRAQQLLRWLTGAIEIQSPAALSAIALYVALGSAVLLYDAARLNLLALGEEQASSLGVDVPALERRILLASSCIVGAIVSLTGLIGFVGLIVPHGVRRIVGPDHRLVLPLSMLLGGTILVLCDLGARLCFRFIATEPPVGAVTALVGGPLFLMLLRRAR